MDQVIALAANLSARLLDESRRIASFIQRRGVWILAFWTVLALGGGLLRTGKFFLAHPHLASDARIPELMAPSLLIAAAPWLAWFLASRAYPHGEGARQPAFRLAAFGTWRRISPQELRSQPAYGFEGFLVSLAVGMLLSMVMRLVTYHLAMPAMPPGAPGWAIAAFRIMTLDVALLSFMYMMCFTMAQRAAPLFPRMLVVTWCYDLLMQFAIAKYVASAGAVPAIVAGPFADMLTGNVRRVLISMTIWLPYLMVSARVNTTFRARVRVRV